MEVTEPKPRLHPADLPVAVREQIERWMSDPERIMPSERASLEALGFVARGIEPAAPS